MIDVLKSVGFDYIFANPGSSFRGLHESAINYGGERYEAVDVVKRGEPALVDVTTQPR
ncbi:MAG: hypothetical protein ACRD4Q_01760 [Candidatus Acidiferrales bacterium]